ncbi:related to general alpha-glucoside permease [Serendipita indica DSM 11827]|uniref:Related to general alpha-glucoside permease n=1 Tax=Serendipita indica (strain DSM 11827) TaxID=1109443 RepID=G4TA34_SERID|nr:related to general alpha-glucoside permease [Serendipita indica DSM 11827]
MPTFHNNDSRQSLIGSETSELDILPLPNHGNSIDDPDVSRMATLTGSKHVQGPKWAHPLILTAAFFANQSIWSTEMAYASPFLQSLGLSRFQIALVFLAAPLSGLIVQPAIGASSDRCTSRFGRRRPFMFIGSILCGLFMLLLAWSLEVGEALGGGHNLRVTIAILSFYCVDFTINAVIAASRTLVVDTLAKSEQEEANMWISRMTGLGALGGFFVGHLHLTSLPLIRNLGETQLQVLSALVAVLLISFHLGTCLLVRERVLVRRDESRTHLSLDKYVKSAMTFVRKHTVHLPLQIKRVCWILFLSWIGWFPFMFFGALWIGDIYRREHSNKSDYRTVEEIDQEASQASAQSMMYYALVAFLSSLLLPLVVAPQKLLQEGTETLEESFSRSQWLIRPLQKRFNLLTVWAFSQVVFALCLFSTVWTTTYAGASIIYAICGFPSALLHWAPHAILGESILAEVYEMPPPASGQEQTALLADEEAVAAPLPSPRGRRKPEQGVRDNPGIVLGVANVAVVSPQFIVIAISAIIFAIFEPGRSVIPGHGGGGRKPSEQFDSITMVFCLGGACALACIPIIRKLRREYD